MKKINNIILSLNNPQCKDSLWISPDGAIHLTNGNKEVGGSSKVDFEYSTTIVGDYETPNITLSTLLHINLEYGMGLAEETYGYILSTGDVKKMLSLGTSSTSRLTLDSDLNTHNARTDIRLRAVGTPVSRYADYATIKDVLISTSATEGVDWNINQNLSSCVEVLKKSYEDGNSLFLDFTSNVPAQLSKLDMTDFKLGLTSCNVPVEETATTTVNKVVGALITKGVLSLEDIE